MLKGCVITYSNIYHLTSRHLARVNTLSGTGVIIYTYAHNPGMLGMHTCISSKVPIAETSKEKP